MNLQYKTANTTQEFGDGKKLFEAYTKTLNLDFVSQELAKEFTVFDQQYNFPSGALLLTYDDANAIACAGIRKIDNETAELRRLFVLPEYRKQNIGKRLLELGLDSAKKLNYKKVRLDSLPAMIQAQTLYRSMGFYEIPAYRFNPIPGAIFMEKIIDSN